MNGNGKGAPSVSRRNGRDRKGRFDKGNPGGPGASRSKLDEALRPLRVLRIVEAEVSDADLRTIVATAIEGAKNGKPADRAWLTPLLLERWQLERLANDAGFTRSLLATLDRVERLETEAKA